MAMHTWLIVVTFRNHEKFKLILLKHLAILLVVFILGLLPIIDNWAHLFAYLMGLIVSALIMPEVGKKSVRLVIVVSMLVTSCLVFLLLVLLFYVTPIYNCDACKFFTCIPFTKDFCKTNEFEVTPFKYTQ